MCQGTLKSPFALHFFAGFFEHVAGVFLCGECTEHFLEDGLVFIADVNDDLFVFFEFKFFDCFCGDDDTKGVSPFFGLEFEHESREEELIYKYNGITYRYNIFRRVHIY